MDKKDKLRRWQERLQEANSAYGSEYARMDAREQIYNSRRKLEPLVNGDGCCERQTRHVRNIVFENVESQVSTSIPQPKVTPRRKQDEQLAQLIEHWLRNELDRLPMEELNDLAERTVPLQGGVGFLVEWDQSARSHDTAGELTISLLHPKMLAPQPGIYSGVRDMDWIIVKVPTTRQALRRRYEKSVDEGEQEPEIRTDKGGQAAQDAVTQYIGYERSDSGSINRYSWCNDTELEDLEDYQGRRQPVCARCGRVRPLVGQVLGTDVPDTLGTDPAEDEQLREMASGRRLAAWLADRFAGGAGGLGQVPVQAPEPKRYDGGACPWCGGTVFRQQPQEYEQVELPITTRGGLTIPGMTPGTDEDGLPVMRPTLIPFYKPDVYPIVLQKSVSVHGQLLGNSDCDVIADQQNTINRLEQKILDRLLKAGTRITLPDDANFRTDPEDGERWLVNNASQKALIGTYDFSGDVSQDMAHMRNVYEEARQILGITDSFQGRKDTTATSGKAKEFSAAQAAGRLESKRIMKQAAYAALFEMMFKMALAYADEPRTVSFRNFRGETEYDLFSRYDFLEQDENGEYWWNDLFLFSCETTAPLAANREAMWQETRMNLQTGAFGDPSDARTLLLFWEKMQELHYPGAGETKQYIEARLQEQQDAMQQQAAQAQAVQAQAAAQPQAAPEELLQAVDAQAQADAARDAGLQETGI